MGSNPDIPKDVKASIRTLAKYAGVIAGGPPKTPDGRGESLGFVYRAKAKVNGVEDGDTLSGELSPFPGVVLSDGIFGYWRLPRVDTHETGGDHAKKAKREKQFTKEWVDTGRSDYQGDDGFPFIVEFENVVRGGDAAGTYGRLLVDLTRRSDGSELNDDLLAKFGDDIRYKPK